ncbi:MAG: hypothetical protein ABSF83_03500 [Nitrososphaerales archaeon]
MKTPTKLVLVILAACVVLALFLLPVVSIAVASTVICPNSPSSMCVVSDTHAQASMMYAYFGVGLVGVPNASGGHAYCLMYGNPGTMCGLRMQRMNQMMTP